MLTSGLDDYGYGVWIRSMEIGGKQHIILSNTNTTDLDAFYPRISRALIK